MALVIGTNCGFVTTAPTSDPTGSNNAGMDTRAWALKVTAPVTSVVVTEIGWWVGNATEEANFEVGIYDHNSGNDKPGNLLTGVSRTNAKGTTSGWKKSSVNISITAGTTYWIAAQLDNTSTQSTIDYSKGDKGNFDSTSTLLNQWGTDSSGAYRVAIYAVWSDTAPATGTNMKINIGDSFKDVDALKINIGDSWKAVTSVKQNIGDSWKTVF